MKGNWLEEIYSQSFKNKDYIEWNETWQWLEKAELKESATMLVCSSSTQLTHHSVGCVLRYWRV